MMAYLAIEEAKRKKRKKRRVRRLCQLARLAAVLAISSSSHRGKRPTIAEQIAMRDVSSQVRP
jgi:exopolyphosphatase/pppGpp-phosphohydrolase